MEGSANVFARIVFEGTGGELSILNDVVVPVCGDVDTTAGTIKAKRSVGRSKKANNRNWEFPSGMALIVK